MTVPDQTPQNVHTANGATTTFAYQFKILDTDHLEVYLDDVLQTSGYSVTGEGVNAGGTVVFTTAPAADTEVILMRSMTIERMAYDYQNAGDFLAATVNEDLDAGIMMTQQINNKLDQRALLFPKTLDRTGNTNALPEPEEGRVLYWASGEVQNALISTLTTNPTFASELRTFDTMAQAIADATIEQTNVLCVADRASSLWDLSSSGTDNGMDVVHLTASNLYARLRINDAVDVKRLGAKGDYDINAGTGTDDTAVFQRALVLAGQLPVIAPPLAYGYAYLITDDLDLDEGQSILGSFFGRAITNSSNRFHNTAIVFKPTSAKDCINVVLPSVGSYTQSVQVQNLMLIAGNSNARHAVAVNKATQSTFRNLSINGFQRSLYMRYTLTNTFDNIQCANATTEHICYDNIDGASISTTDIWHKCSFTLAPLGGTIKYAQCIRFDHCLFESLDTGAFDIYKDCVGISFSECYAEDVPAVNSASNYCFQVGVNGTAKQTARQLTVMGGHYGGRNAGAVGTFVACSDIDYVSIIDAFATRYTNYVTSTASTPAYRIHLIGAPRQTVTNLYNDITKVSGEYQGSVLGGSSSPRLNVGIVKGNTGIASTLAAGDATGGAKSYKLPIYDNTETFIGYAQVYV